MNILITGSSTGIGKALADKFSQEGHTVIGTYNTSKGTGYHLDLSDESDIRLLVNNVKEIDVLINNAFDMTTGKKLEDMSFEFIDKAIKTNLGGTFKLTTALLPKIKKMVINIGSSVIFTNKHKKSGLYKACKAGVRSLTSTIVDETDLKAYTIHPSKTAVKRNEYLGVPTDKVVEVVYNTVMGQYKLDNGADVKVDRDYRFGPHLRTLFIVARKVKDYFI